MNSLHLTVTTPEEVLIDEEVSEVVIPTVSGEIAVLPAHTDLVTQLKAGELVIKRNGKEEYFAVVGGFVQIKAKEVMVLADYAAKGADLSVVEAQKAKERAEKALQEKLSDQDMAIAQADLTKALLELRVANRHTQRSH